MPDFYLVVYHYGRDQCDIELLEIKRENYNAHKYSRNIKIFVSKGDLIYYHVKLYFQQNSTIILYNIILLYKC
jgi:hypothetical protein